ncbi:uncharacterized protein LOC114876263 [Osmia bicornis bicornis]|uniref:uncharacterized protein LOC114876263 n=1 Tax=Osmia bicornis bicornis TaxID=1437191 RepID=UPI0010F6FA0E|nr:uncharacterized protein LOC114876263 [Osmia bicornis bicornis]
MERRPNGEGAGGVRTHTEDSRGIFVEMVVVMNHEQKTHRAKRGKKKGGDLRRKAGAIKEAPVRTMGIKHLNMKVFAITLLLAFVATAYAGYISSGWSGGGGGWSGGGGGGW